MKKPNLAQVFLWLFYISIFLLLVTIYLTQKAGSNRGKSTNAYNKVQACILSKNAVGRSQADIERCYTVVEKDSGVKLQRYDKE